MAHANPALSIFGQSMALLRTRRFGTFWFASLLANIGTWAQQVAQPWLLVSMGASPFLIGLDSFAGGAPVWLLTLVGGILADRGDRRRIIAIFQSIQMLCPTLLVVLLLTGLVQPWIIISMSLVIGVTDALSMPSFQSIVPSIVTREQIPSALALNATQFNLSRVIGPALAGILMTTAGAVGCFATNALSYLPFIFVALWILPKRAPRPASDDTFDAHHPFAGMRDLLRRPRLRGAFLTVLATSSLCGPLITFAPVLVKTVFNGEIAHFSGVMGAFGAGGLLGAIGLLAVDPLRDRRPISLRFATAFALVVILASLAPWFWALPVLMLVAGICMSVSNTSVNTLVQGMVDQEVRGSAVSLFMVCMRGGLALGSLLTGLTASLIGVRHALLANGILALLAHLYVARMNSHAVADASSSPGTPH
jgi:MFS family permease